MEKGCIRNSLRYALGIPEGSGCNSAALVGLGEFGTQRQRTVRGERSASVEGEVLAAAFQYGVVSWFLPKGEARNTFFHVLRFQIQNSITSRVDVPHI